eukprot:CAMPEP_0202861838 /NCGR_PEP_ID=MMETSP1391-20130828/3092_1 /ASSEMBLY_ACC=CAM_ASM_000867 /TAXON_ID=1034604 /ORGANISM="Chlamydomonas leiostraca, Strain SAG 11-49" /LENGTH=661 /DNA_ID=CAMNT_0049541275 /DNA_START=138 /DNA_END=2123 /DNA_ORIENTATION=-
MASGLFFSLALVALLAASAQANRALLQSKGSVEWFPFYGACLNKTADNRIILSGEVTETAVADGVRACFKIELNGNCPVTVAGKPNVCCEGYKGLAANVYKFEVLMKDGCRNSIPNAGDKDDGPMIIRSNGEQEYLALNYESFTTPSGKVYQKARFTGLDLFADQPGVDGAQVCFTMNKRFPACLGLSNLCYNSGATCQGDVTLIESDKLPRPESKHACCPITDKKCPDRVTCPAPNYVPKPNWDRIDGATVEECCNPQYCPQRFGPPSACGDDYKPRPGFDTIFGGSRDDCCLPKTCADHQVVCADAPFVTPKPDYNTIIGKTPQQCCDYKYCPAFVPSCPAGWTPLPGYETLKGDTVAECCRELTCQDNLPNGCGEFGEPLPNFDTIKGDTLEECCVPKQEQKFPFPYCRCEGSYSRAAAERGDAASGDDFLTGDLVVGGQNLPYRLTPSTEQPTPTLTYTEYCFDLWYLGATPAANPRNITQFCAAQTSLYRVEFLSKPECDKTDFTAVYYRPAYTGDAVAYPLGVEDQDDFAADGVTPIYNDVIDPETGASFKIARAAMKAVKIDAYVQKALGTSVFEQVTAPTGAGQPPADAGSICLRLKTSATACSNLRDFCGSEYYFYKSAAPVGEEKAVRCEWALMESSNQRCCPVQTIAKVL